MPELRDREADGRQFHTESQNVGQSSNVRMIISCHLQGCRKTLMQNLQDCRKTKRYVVQFPHCSRAVIVRFAVFLRQPCNKAHVHLAVVSRPLYDKYVAGKLLCQSCIHLACLAAVLRQPCVPYRCLKSFRKRTQIAKKMNMSKI